MEHQTENMAEDDTKEILKKKAIKSVVLDSFTKLTSTRDKVRIAAGVNLLKYLSAPENSENKSEHTYALERLIRGIGSNSTSSKTGYFSVIVTLLTRTSTVTAELVLSIVKKQLITRNKNCKSENADISMGQILICGALIRSDMYTKSTDEDQKQIIELILNASKKRSYLSLAAYTFLTELLDKVNDTQFATIWSVIKPVLEKPFKEQTLDTIYFLCIARSKFPSIVKTKFVTKHLEVPDIIHEESIAGLCELLMNNLLMLQSTNHPIYHYISKEVAQTNLVPAFCAELDTHLQKHNRSKHICITNMLTDMLNNLSDHSVIPDMLTTQFMTQTLTAFKILRAKDRDTELLDKLETFFTTLTTALQKEVSTKTKIAVLKLLLVYPGTFMFEMYTGLKVIQHITMDLNEDGIKKLCKMYKSVVLGTLPKTTGGEKTEHWINAERVYAAQMMVKLFNFPVVQKDTDWRLEHVKFLLNFGLFEEQEESSVGVELASDLKDCFYRALDQKLPKLEDLRNLLSSLVHYIDEAVFKNKDRKLRSPLPETGAEIWTKMMELIANLEGKKKFKHSFAVPVFHTLVLLMGLQLFSEFEMAQTSLKELHSCIDRLTTDKSPKKKKLEEGKVEENEPVWIEVVIDLFLSLLSHNSHLLRNIIGCVFPFLCPKLTMTAVRQILDILDPKNDQNPLSKNKDSDDEDKSDDEADETEESADDEEVEEEEESTEESEDSGLEEAVVEENQDGHETTTDKLRIALRQALHKTGYQTDDESEDIDEMDEDSGKKLDAALAEAFKMVKKNNKGKKLRQTQDDKTLTHFRVRVLDLVEMYLDSEPSMLQCLEIACTLLQTLEFSIRDVHQQPLEIRTRSCLKRLSGLRKFSSTEDVNEEILATMLNSFLDKGSKSAFVYQDMGDIISACCIFIIRCEQIISSTATDATSPKKKKKGQASQIVGIFKSSLETFFNKRDCLLPVVLFKDAVQVSWEGNWILMPLLVNYAFNSEIRPFRRSQALDLLGLFYSNNRFRIANFELFKTHISPIEKELSNKTIELLQKLLSNHKECKVREKFVGLLLTLLTAVKSASASDNMDWSSIGEAIRMYRSRVSLASDAKKAYNKLCGVLGISNRLNATVKMQQNGAGSESAGDTEGNASQTNDEDKQTAKKKRKKAKSMKKDAHKLKKEARLLRLQASSEGLTNETAFSAVSLSDIPNEENNDTSETDNEPKRKKKKKFQQVDEANDDEAPDVEEKKSKKLKKKHAINNTSENTNQEQDTEMDTAPAVKRKKPKKNK